MKNFIFLFLILVSSTTLFSQNLTVMDIDTINFPKMKAKIVAFNNSGEQILNFNTSDIKVSENGIQRVVTNINCPEKNLPVPLSSVLVMDASGSMANRNLDLAKVAAKIWIENLPLSQSECAITTFNHSNQLIQDFTQNKDLLLSQIGGLYANGGTDYNQGLYQPVAGGLHVSKRGKFKKVIIFLTDGVASTMTATNSIVNEANSQNCSIYTVVLGFKSPESLRQISEATGGICFDNINNAEEISNIYKQILVYSQRINSCDLEWLSEAKCDNNLTKVNFKLESDTNTVTRTYKHPYNFYYHMDILPKFLSIKNIPPGKQLDTTIKVTARNINLYVTDIISSNPCFSVTPKSFNILDGQSIDLKLTYIPTDSGYTFCELNFVDNSICQNKILVSGGFVGIKPKLKSLKLTQPNGAEKFAIGLDTLITWEGVTESDTLKIEYTIDNGKNWKTLTNSGTDLEYIWKDIPSPSSDSCLVRIKQLAKDFVPDIIPDIKWSKTYGGTGTDRLVNIIKSNEGGYICAGTTTSTDGDVENNLSRTSFWVVKIDEEGSIIWKKVYSAREFAYPSKIKQTSDGGYIIVGTTDSIKMPIELFSIIRDIWVVKINVTGDLEWQKTYGNKYDDSGVDIFETNDNNFIIGGMSQGLDDSTFNANQRANTDIYLSKIDKNGNIIWEKTYGGGGNESIGSMLPTNDGGFITVGYSNSSSSFGVENQGMYDYLVVKFNSNGNIIWKNTFGGSRDDLAKEIVELANGNFLIGGNTSSSDGDVVKLIGIISSVWFVEISPNGLLKGQNTFGGNWEEKLNSLEKCINDDILITGFSNSTQGDYSDNKGMSDLWVLKLDKSQKILWKKTFGGSKDESSSSGLETDNGGILVAGYTNSTDLDVKEHHGSSDYWVIKLDFDDYSIQDDISDSVFSIVKPIPSAFDIDMGKVLVSDIKDSLIVNFLINSGQYKCKIDSIYFSGTDAEAFSLVSGIPPLIVEMQSGYNVEFRFTPNRIGNHQAFINVATQTELLQYKIIGEGIEKRLTLISRLLDFGKVNVGLSKDTVHFPALYNMSSIPITLSNIKIIQKPGYNFSIIKGGESTTLNAGDTLFLDLSFSPDKKGFQDSYIEFKYDGFGSPLNFNIYGEGVLDISSSGFIEVLDAQSYVNEKVNVYIIARGNNYFELSGATGFNVQLNYNPTLLSPINNNYQIIDDKNANIKLSNLPVNFKAGDTLSTILFDVGLGNEAQCNLDLTNIEIIGGDAQVEVDNGKFTLLGICEEGGKRLINPNNEFKLLNISPNPSDGNITIGLYLIESGFTTVNIFNSSGQIIFERIIESTTRNLNIEIDTRKFSNGLYFVNLLTPTIRKTEKLIIFK